jgi:hypothetical protein
VTDLLADDLVVEAGVVPGRPVQREAVIVDGRDALGLRVLLDGRALPESSASTTSTLAPLVIAASAWVCIVLLLPCAFCTLKSSALRPAASNALVRYGASNET